MIDYLRNPLLFKSFIGLSVKQFDDIYDEIKSNYTKYEIKHVYLIESIGNASIGGGRHFKLDVKNRIIMVFDVLICFISLILLQVFLFDLDQSNICTETYKRSNY